jgi:hypothetical protein
MKRQVSESLIDCPALKEINRLYGHYYDDPQYVYKMCLDQYIVIMKKLPNTLTNENRTNIINARYAKFRANCLEVCVIFDVNDCAQTRKHIINQYNDKQTKYEVNCVVTPDGFDIDLENVCSGGIHYFNSMRRTFYYGIKPFDYTGYWFGWYDNGQKYCQGTYLDGVKNGNWIFFRSNGQIYLEGKYQDNIKIDNWIKWSRDGKTKKSYWYGSGSAKYLDVKQSSGTSGAMNQGSVDYYNHNHKYKLLDVVMFIVSFIYIFKK